MNITLNGLNVHYTVSGHGHAVILLHGWGANLQTVRQIQADLSRDFNVYALDFPGFGESDDPPQAWAVMDYVKFLRAFIEHFQMTDPILLGHSFGGKVSICYAAQYSVRKLILVNSAGIKPKRSVKYYVKVYTFKTAKNFLQLPLLRKFTGNLIIRMKQKFGSDDYKNTSGVMQQTIVKVINEDVSSFMPNVKVPVLLIWGDQDTATPVSDAKRMEALMPDAGLAILKNAGHYSYLDKPREFRIIVDHFLGDDKGGKQL